MKSEILIKDHDLESPSHTAWLLCGLLLPCLPRTITIVVTDQCIAAYLQQTVPSDYRYQDDGRMSSALLAQLCKMVVVISPRSILSNDYQGEVKEDEVLIKTPRRKNAFEFHKHHRISRLFIIIMGCQLELCTVK